jgi:serine-type D-Ala-D-Ala carboxypeptidase (penicillin-binding protein 5/6)
MSHTSPFLERSARALRAREAKMRKRRRRRQIVAFALTAILVGGAWLALSRSSPTHGSASASRGAHGHAVTHATPMLSAIGLPLGRPPLHLTLARTDDAGVGQAGADGTSATIDDPVRVAFHRPPRAGLLFNLDNGKVLWELNPLAHLHIASLTKMMTALRVLRSSSSPNEEVLVTKAAINSAGSKVGVLPLGKHVRLKTMLYGLMLPSGNDAAMALAQHVSGSANTFVEGMNREAARLGMGCTHYTSPSGYVNARNYSCAADLAELAHVDLEQPLLARIVRTEKAILPFPIKGGKLYLYNNNPLLVYDYPGATGLKTGYTELAGQCLVGTAERGGVRLGVVLLHSPELGRQAEYLLDRGFENAYDQAPIAAPPVPVGR